MADEAVRVGLIGANVRQSWAKLSHIPAIQSLAPLRLVAVATSNPDTARAAGRMFHVARAYASAFDLVADADVELVSVCVKVPHHRDIVRAAVDRKKHVLCEWPLALSVEEATDIAARAGTAGVHAAVGLQGRMSPAARRARELIAGGALGRPLTANIVSTTEGHGSRLPGAYAYLCDPANGATMSTILTGHTLDLATYVLGAISEVSAMTAIKYGSVELTDSPGRVTRSTPDHLLVQARFESGCTLSAEIDGGRPADTPFTFRIIGTEGTLCLRGGHPYGFQAGELRLEASVPHDAPDAPANPELTGSLANVGELYACLARDIRSGERRAPGFFHALKLHRLIRSVGVAAESGIRQRAEGWPTA